MGLLAFFASLAAVGAAQEPRGSLAGVLTDLHSQPIANAKVILHNSANGDRIEGTTQRNGRYRFERVPAGEYWLEVRSTGKGQGTLDGLYVAAGSEIRLRTAVALGAARLPQKPALAQTPVGAVNPQEQRAEAAKSQVGGAAELAVSHPAAKPAAPIPAETRPPQVAEPARTIARVVEAPVMPLQPSLPAAAEAIHLPGGIVSTGSARPSFAASGAALASAAGSAVRLVLESAKLAAFLSPAELTPEDAAGASVSSIDAVDLQQLPMEGRDWAAFLGSRGTAEIAAPDDTQRDADAQRPRAKVTVDGMQTAVAFGGRGERRLASGDLMDPEHADTSVGEVKTSSETGAGTGNSRIAVSTRRGSAGLHGQAFLFSRQNLWNARNPFTQRIEETAAATATTIPVFTPVPYTPPDRRLTWGVAAGGALRRSRIFWFAALEGDERNDPGVATVRHSDKFFAQPSNDEMQVLSARLGMSSRNPVAEGVGAYSSFLESVTGLLGESPRTSSQLTGFARIDFRVGERNHVMLEGSGGRQDAPGGALGRVSEMYGTHSFGESRGSSAWSLARWERFLTPNLLTVTQGSFQKQVLSVQPETPSPFEQSLNASRWGQLPQMVVDSRYGFSIGTPARFGRGSYPDESNMEAREGVDWIHGALLVKAGFEVRHSGDATSRVVDHAGTFHYAYVENFASDALTFLQYGLSNLQNPLTTPHNCDERGKAWRDAAGQLYGLGHLPCYSYYTQTLGPTDWHLSTNDWGSYGTLQWQIAKSFVLSAGMRWDRVQTPPPIAMVMNPDLPLAGQMPSLGNEWGPRVSAAWGRLESHWPVLRAGYGMYFGRTSNAVLEKALTQTGSLKGDVNVFMRPTDGFTSATGTSVAPPFPYVLAGVPSSIEKPAVVEFASGFRNPEIHQAQVGIEEQLPGRILLQASAEASLGRRLPVTVDTNFDPAVNPKTITYNVVDASGKGPLKARQITVPFFASWPTATGIDGRANAAYQQITAIEDRANSTYEAATVDVTRYAARGLTLRAHYIYAHAMDWNPNASAYGFGGSVLDPTNLRQEYGTSGLDIRHSASAMFIWRAPWRVRSRAGALVNGWLLSGTARYHSGLPYTMRSVGSIPKIFTASGAAIVGLGPSMNGYGGDRRVYGVGRNTYRYPFMWKADARVGRTFHLHDRRQLELLAESFNLFNHQNVTQIETAGYILEPGTASGSLPYLNFLAGIKAGQTGFGQPLDVNATDFYRERQFDFGFRLRY